MNATGIALPSPAPRLAILVALAVVYLVWGSTYFAIRIAVEGYPPFLMGAMRMAVPGAVMLLVLRWRGALMPNAQQWRTLIALSIFMVLLSNGLVNVAEQEVSSGMAAIAVASMPLWAALFAALRRDHPSRGEWVGLAIGFSGVLWLHAGSDLAATPKGMIALLIAPVAWAWGSIWSRSLSLPPPFVSAAGQMVCGAGWMLLASAATGERLHAWPELRSTLAVVYLGVFGSVLAFTAYVWLLQNVRSVLATSYAYVNPPIAVLLGALLLGERFSAHDLGAMTVILLGVVLITVSKAKRA